MATFSFLPNLGVSEIWQWQTDVITTRRGAEQRLNVSERARVSQVVDFSAVTQEERRSLWALLAGNLNSTSVVPLFAWSGPVTAAASAGDTSVMVDTRFMSLNASDRVVFINILTGDTFSILATGVTDTSITFAASIPQNVSEDWFAFKAMLSVLDNDSSLGLQSISGSFQIEANSWVSPPVERTGTTAAISTFNSLPVLEKEALQGTTENISWQRDITDFGIGRANLFANAIAPTAARSQLSFSISRFDPSDVDYWRLFLNTVRGSWKAFLISTQMEDLTLSSTLSQGGTTMNVNEENIGTLFLNYKSFENFEITYSDGTTSRHTAASVSGQEITFSPALPSDPKVSNVEKISYLLKVRMADRMSWTHGVMRSRITFNVTTTESG